MKNTWGIQFTEIDHENDGFITHKALNIGNEVKTNNLWDKIKRTYPAAKDSNYIIDLLDEDDSIVDDYSISKRHFINLAEDLGHDLPIK